MAKMNIGPSEGMLRDLVKKKKIKSIKMKTKINMNDPEEADETSPDDEDSEDSEDNNSLDSHAASDMEDEEEGIKTYGKRQKQHPAKKSIFSKMQKDERRHKGILSKMRA